MFLSEGMRMLRRRIACSIFGVKKYKGNADEICAQIIKRCWNGKYFQTSAGHFNEFYTRDFAWCVPSLLKLGYKKEVHSTLAYVLACFERHKKVTTSINPEGIPFDFPCFAADSFPYLVFSLAIADARDLIKKHRKFLELQVEDFCTRVVGEKGLPRPLHFSSMKDHSIRKSSCYDTCMAGLLAKFLKHLGWKSILDSFDYPALLKKHYWTGSYFLNDLSGEKSVCGDANVFPFLTGQCTKEMHLKAIKSIERAGLDNPLPLRYSARKLKERRILYSIFAPNYEGTVIWAHLGMLYFHTLSQIDAKKAAQVKDKYKKIIEKYGNFVEVFSTNLKPYRSLFYFADDSMLWASMYLAA